MAAVDVYRPTAYERVLGDIAAPVEEVEDEEDDLAKEISKSTTDVFFDALLSVCMYSSFMQINIGFQIQTRLDN